VRSAICCLEMRTSIPEAGGKTGVLIGIRVA
jgi:hypothetical protein